MSTSQVFEVKRSWWYTFFRGISAFCYRYWWLVWFIFIFYIILWFIFCFNKPDFICSEYNKIETHINDISQRIDNCCNCSVVNKIVTPPNAKPCDYDEINQGGKGIIETIHQLGSKPGSVVINYDMDNIPDKMEVFYDDQLVASTDKLVSYKGSLSFYYPAQPGKPTFCKIIISAPRDGTIWFYHIGCPR